MAAEVVFEPSPQRLVCKCGITLKYTKEDLIGHTRDFQTLVQCPVCQFENQVKSTVTGETK